jgi:hypothetical protein
MEALMKKISGEKRNRRNNGESGEIAKQA